MSTSNFNQLNPAQTERLAILTEECGEVLQIVGKIQRHGYMSVNPTLPPERQLSNRRLLEIELGHVQAAVARLIASGDVIKHEMRSAELEKIDRHQNYLHHQ